MSQAGSDRRTQIVAAAIRILERQGFQETSMKEIAREAGVAQGLLHYYFASKDELLIAILTALYEQLGSDLREIVETSFDPKERLVKAIDHFAQRSQKHPQFFRLVNELRALAMTKEALADRYQILRQQITDNMEVELRGILGQLPAYTIVSPRPLAETVVAAIDGIAAAALIKAQNPDEMFYVLKVLVLSLIVAAYVSVGQEAPTAELRGLLRRSSEPLLGSSAL